MAVKRIKAGGELRPVLFGWGALMAFEEDTGESPFAVMNSWMTGDMEKISVKTLVGLFHAGFENGAFEVGEKFEYTPRHVANWMGEAGLQKQLMDLFMLQMPKMDEGDESAGEQRAAKKKG